MSGIRYARVEMGRTTGQWRCRICGFERGHVVTVKRRNGALYTTSSYACSGCSVMFLNPEQLSVLGGSAECRKCRA